MTDIATRTPPTEVLFPEGTLHAKARVQRVEHDADGRLLLVTDRTPFHPLDHTWPDQPADRGTVVFGGTRHTVIDAVTGAVGPGAVGPGAEELLTGGDIPVRRGDPDWSFVVVHVLDRPEDGTAPPAVGQEVDLAVDGEHRAGLSAGHSACHLVSLALNERTADLWSKKPPRLDCLGNPDFDQTAIAESRILPYGSVDRYRLGKSLRKAGFAAAVLAERLAELQDAVNGQVAAWIAAGGAARIDREESHLSARRWWTCDLPSGRARIPCGGTHVASTADLGSVTVTLDLSPGELTVRTRVAP
ncbi:metal-dependent hydrolase [Streptomyces desertarenae]|uniref:Metal-dependent hydrolase n=1 Tax=Streptomyces desertarenae TaxID=2666184 RepID=A0ABW4PLS7_9ACTN